MTAPLSRAARSRNRASSATASSLERTCFQTGQAWSAQGNLRSDVAIVYGIDPGLPARVQTWRECVTLAGETLGDWRWDRGEGLVWIRLTNSSIPRELAMRF